MATSRRFLSLIVDNPIVNGAKSLIRIDPMRHKLFNTPSPSAWPLNGNTPPESVAGKPRMATIRLPAPSFNFQASAEEGELYMHCFPLTGDKVLCTDQSGRSALFKADMCEAETMPFLHATKRVPLSVFVPDDDDNDGGGRIYIMECSPVKEYSPRREWGGDTQLSYQFEAFVNRRASMTSFAKSWHCELLPRPPFTCSPKYYPREFNRPTICSYAVVGGGSHVCVSVDYNAGTYCLDTATHTWSHVGDWMLPFTGKVEYVPELKLWFGFCTDDGSQIGAADLSTMMDMDSQQPQLLYTWKDFEAPQEWVQLRRPQLANLGYGRFCIARFIRALNPEVFDPYAPGHENFTVLTGMDVVPYCVRDSNGTAKVELKMVKHNSRRHMSYGSDGKIDLVF